MTPPRAGDLLRAALPRSARERLYELHPGRARRWRLHPGIERVPGTGTAVLTFDDGPDADATPAVLDELDRAGARATFFMLGSRVTESSELASEVIQRGHEVGLHGFDHIRQDRADPARGREDITRGAAALEDALGVRCSWYRPPYGKMSDAAAGACHKLGLTTVYWSAWGLDWEEVGADRIAARVRSQLRDGAIVLLHDSARHARRRSARPTVEAIAPIAASARELGLALVSLGDAAGAGTAPFARELPATRKQPAAREVPDTREQPTGQAAPAALEEPDVQGARR